MFSQYCNAKIIKMRPTHKMNTEKEDFDQCLECAAHKFWSKYTTMGESKPWEKEKVEQEKSLIIDYLSPFLQVLPIKTCLYVATL